MCLVAVSVAFRQYLRQEKARIRYRYSKWQSNRVNQRWMKRQLSYRRKVYRDTTYSVARSDEHQELDFYGCQVDKIDETSQRYSSENNSNVDVKVNGSLPIEEVNCSPPEIISSQPSCDTPSSLKVRDTSDSRNSLPSKRIVRFNLVPDTIENYSNSEIYEESSAISIVPILVAPASSCINNDSLCSQDPETSARCNEPNVNLLSDNIKKWKFDYEVNYNYPSASFLNDQCMSNTLLQTTSNDISEGDDKQPFNIFSTPHNSCKLNTVAICDDIEPSFPFPTSEFEPKQPCDNHNFTCQSAEVSPQAPITSNCLNYPANSSMECHAQHPNSDYQNFLGAAQPCLFMNSSFVNGPIQETSNQICSQCTPVVPHCTECSCFVETCADNNLDCTCQNVEQDCNISEECIGVLSPQHLSQRLNENALAREAVGGSDAELAQYLADERVALFLQNDEFMQELRTNRDFMAALERDHQERVDATSLVDFEENLRQDSAYRFSKLRQVDDATLRARIATMSKASRKKFAQIAKVFSRGGKRTGTGSVPQKLGLVGQGPMNAAVAREGGAGTDHLLEANHSLADEEDNIGNKSGDSVSDEEFRDELTVVSENRMS